MPIKTSRFDVDILSQSLSEIIIRNKYGAATPTAFAVAVTANAKTQLVAVTGKGMVYGVVAYIQGTDIQHDDYLTYNLDGVVFDDVSLEYFMLFNDVLVPGALGWLGCYDEINYRYALHIGTNISFETGSSISYNETHGRTPIVFGVAFYALI